MSPTLGSEPLVSDSLGEFRRRLQSEWLPAFCEARGYHVEGFVWSSLEKLDAMDGENFLSAVDAELFVDAGGGRYFAPRKGPVEQIFWQGLRSKSPRPITLWREPIITAAALGQLFFVHQWPKKLLGTQSRGLFEFDIIAAHPESLDDKAEYAVELIAGEVKKSESEVEKMLVYMIKVYCASGGAVPSDVANKNMNAHRKCLGLLRLRPRIFWAVGPNGYQRVFRASYSGGACVSLNETTRGALDFAAVNKTSR